LDNALLSHRIVEETNTPFIKTKKKKKKEANAPYVDNWTFSQGEDTFHRILSSSDSLK